MASKSILASVIFLAALYLLLMKEPSDYSCSTTAAYKHGLTAKAGDLKVTPSRKLVEALYALKDEKTSSKDQIHRLHGSALRKVPSGPDPLHHNGGNPKKPRTP